MDAEGCGKDLFGQSVSMKDEYHRYTGRKILFISLCALTIVCAGGYALTLGVREIGFLETFGIIWNHLTGVGYDLHSDGWWDDFVLWEDRLPRVVVAVIAGAGLAIGGAAMQSVVKNPLADPYTTGISSGAVLGITAAIVLGTSIGSFGSNYGMVLNAFVFGLVPTAVAIAVTKMSNASPATIILAGTAMSYLLNAASTLLLVTAEAGKIQEAFLWQVGTLEWVVWDDVPLMFVITLVGGIVLLFFSRQLNLLLFGDKSAKSLGLDVDNFRLIVLLILSLATASIVSFVGIIGFVGLVSPHIVRMFIGSDNRFVIPASALFGAAFLLVADLIARTVIAPGELPVGVIMSFIGGPIFLILIIKSRKGMW